MDRAGRKQRENDLWDAGVLREVSHAVPDLAYWDRLQAKAWERKFEAKHAYRPRIRKYHHALHGVLACVGCGSPLVGAGDGYYQCPLKPRVGECPRPQKLSEAVAFKALRGIYRFLIPSPEHLSKRAWAEAQRDDTSELLAQLDLLRQKEAAWTETVGEMIDAGLKVPPAHYDKLRGVQQQAEEVEARIVEQRVSYSGDLVARLAQALATDPLFAVAPDRTPEERGRAYRALVRGVVIEATGWGAARQWRVLDFEPLMKPKEEALTAMQRFLSEFGTLDAPDAISDEEAARLSDWGERGVAHGYVPLHQPNVDNEPTTR